MIIGVVKELYPDEKRVAATPQSVIEKLKLGHEVIVEPGAGALAQFSDKSYIDAGAKVLKKTDVYAKSDIIIKVRAPLETEIKNFRKGQLLICFIWPAQNEELIKKLKAKKISVLAMDMVPRISRAQKLDALSSMSNIAGYRAVIESANHFGRFFTGQITAAGKIPPAIILIIGAGVAGLAAIGAANSMGAIVRAFDTRKEVKEQIESMGAEFLELDYQEEDEDNAINSGYAKQMSKAFIKAEMALFAEQAKEVDIIITTALIPGKPAPKLITKSMVKSMKPGSVIVDLAAEQGGNCEFTVAGEVTENHDVKIIGYTDLVSRLATQSSQLYAANIRHLLNDLTPNKDGELHHNVEDEVIRNITVIKEGEITWPPPEISVKAVPSLSKVIKLDPPPAVDPKALKRRKLAITLSSAIVCMLSLFAIGSVAPLEFMSHLTVFVLAVFIGWQLIWNVTPALHTPLMSVTNAISGIIVIGALLKIDASSWQVIFLSAIAVLIATINISGGFLVTQRMLKMFKRDEDKS